MRLDFDEKYCEEALVVFEKDSNIKILRLLKEGFRHCFVVIKISGGWLELNPMSNRLVVVFHAGESFAEVPSFVRKRKDLIWCRVKVMATPQKCAPFFFFTCVEFVKRFLGLHDFFIMTPYQLYKKLKIVGKKS